MVILTAVFASQKLHDCWCLRQRELAITKDGTEEGRHSYTVLYGRRHVACGNQQLCVSKPDHPAKLAVRHE